MWSYWSKYSNPFFMCNFYCVNCMDETPFSMVAFVHWLGAK